MKIEKIIYEAGRNLSLNEKIWLSSIFIYAQNDKENFASLLFSEDKVEVLEIVRQDIERHDIEIGADIFTDWFLEAVERTAEKIKEILKKEDFLELDFLNAIFEKDEFAMACLDILDSVSSNFKS